MLNWSVELVSFVPSYQFHAEIGGVWLVSPSIHRCVPVEHPSRRVIVCIMDKSADRKIALTIPCSCAEGSML